MTENIDKNKAAKQRDRDVKRIYDKTELILAEYVPSPENIPTGIKFNEILQKISMRLVEETHTTKDFNRANKHLGNIIRGDEEKYNKSLPLQTEVTTPRLPKQLRTESFFNISNDVQNSYYNFLENVEEQDDYLKNPNIAYCLLMLSFIVHSGVCHQEV